MLILFRAAYWLLGVVRIEKFSGNVLVSIFRCIWMERNSRVFSDVSQLVDFAWDHATF